MDVEVLTVLAEAVACNDVKAKDAVVRRLLTILAALGLATVGGVVVALKFWPSFGGSVSAERVSQLRASPQYRDGRFENEIPQTPRTTAMMWDYAKWQYMGTELRRPPAPIPVVPVATATFNVAPAPGLRAIWFGHATVYLEVDGVRVMVDPILSEYASPVAGIGPKRFHAPPLALAALPRIDAVMISHDHYDHLDMRTIQQLQATGSHFFVPLGVGAHLVRWGVPQSQYTELDWWQSATVKGLQITSTPVRHYSGRGLRDGNATLWSSWVIVSAGHRIFYSGDTGFSGHFQTIGERFGPFDLSLIKIGAYGPGQTWIDIHMDPEDAIKAHLMLKAKRMLPVHWGTFNLAFHAWDEPIERAVKAARASGVDLVTPRVGEVVTANAPFVSYSWWILPRNR